MLQFNPTHLTVTLSTRINGRSAPPIRTATDSFGWYHTHRCHNNTKSSNLFLTLTLQSDINRCPLPGTKHNCMEPINQRATEITVVYKSKQPVAERPQINTSGDALIHLLEGYDLQTIGLQEQFIVMYLNRSNAVLGLYRCSIGGLTGTVADVRLILSVALKIAATGIILSHNHPSGNLNPSRADEELTSKIRDASKLMEITVLDHIIVDPGGTKFYSFADHGQL